jgi:hypothetical protein
MRPVVKVNKNIISLLLCILIMGCAASHTAINKRQLDVQTKMSETIFLDPVGPEKRTVFVQVKNTSAHPELNLAAGITNAIANNGYTIVTDPDKANYLLQANVLKVGKTDLRDTEDALSKGFGGALTGGLAGGAVGALASDKDEAVIAGGLIGAAAGLIADAMVKDVSYSIITDIQLSERAEGISVKEEVKSSLKQGTSGTRNVSSTEKHNWKRYQTRIVSSANKVNLKLEDALPTLISGLSNSISGLL